MNERICLLEEMCLEYRTIFFFLPFLHKEEKEARGAIVIDGSMTPMRAAHSEKEGALLFFILWD